MNCNICKVEMERELTVSIIPNFKFSEVKGERFPVCSMKCLEEFYMDSGLEVGHILGLPAIILE